MLHHITHERALTHLCHKSMVAQTDCRTYVIHYLLCCGILFCVILRDKSLLYAYWFEKQVISGACDGGGGIGLTAAPRWLLGPDFIMTITVIQVEPLGRFLNNPLNQNRRGRVRESECVCVCVRAEITVFTCISFSYFWTNAWVSIIMKRVSSEGNAAVTTTTNCRCVGSATTTIIMM